MSLIGGSPAAVTHSRPLASDLGALLDNLSNVIHDETSEPTSASFAMGTHGQRLFAFGIAGGAYAVPLDQVVEMQRLPAVTRLPNVPDWVRGVVNLRGDIVSVVDPATFLHLHEETRTDHGRKLVVLRSLDSDLQIGLVVDHVYGLRSIPASAIRSPTGSLHNSVTPYLRGVCDVGEQMLVVLEAERLLKALSEAFVEK
jgi:purine-binding chemotaxis protein CheW